MILRLHSYNRIDIHVRYSRNNCYQVLLFQIGKALWLMGQKDSKKEYQDNYFNCGSKYCLLHIITAIQNQMHKHR